MATIEKLFVQIFERKRQIIERLKHQKHLYDQHLASKLLIQGIPPPPWLLNSDFPSSFSDHTALNKEELISGLLLPQPGHLASYASGVLYDKPIAKAANNELPDETCTRTCASNAFDEDEHGIFPSSHVDATNNWPGFVPMSHVNGNENTPNNDPMSHLGQADKRISNTDSKPQQSLARIQRSKSRQKALELRNSAKASGRSCLGKENNVGFPSGSNTFRLDEQIDGLRESLELVKPSALSAKTCTKEEEAIGDCLNKERSDTCSNSSSRSGSDGAKEVQIGDEEKRQKSNVYQGRITRSRSHSSEFIVGGHHGKSDVICVGMRARSMSDKTQHAEINDPRHERVTGSRSYHEQSVNGDHSIGNTKVSSGRISRSRSCAAKEAETGDQRSKIENVMTVKPKQLDFDEVEESCLVDILNHVSSSKEGQDKLEESNPAYTTAENSGSLPLALSAERTSEKSIRPLAYETLEALQREDAHSLSPIGPQLSEEHILRIIEENAKDTCLSRLEAERMTGLSSQKDTFEPEGEQSLGDKANSCESEGEQILGDKASSCASEGAQSLGDKASSCESEGEQNLGKEASTFEAEGEKSFEKEANDQGLPKEDSVQLSPGRNSAGSLSSAIDFAPAITWDEKKYEHPLESVSKSADIRASCFSSHDNDVGCSKLLELGNEVDILAGYNFSYTMDGSWPCYKRRKMEYQHLNKSANPSLRVNPFQATSENIPYCLSGSEKVNSPPTFQNLIISQDSDAMSIEYQHINKSASPCLRVNPFQGTSENIPHTSAGAERMNLPATFQNLIISQVPDAEILNSEILSMETDQRVKCSLSMEPKLTPQVPHEEGEDNFGRSVSTPFTCEHRQLSTPSVSNVKLYMIAEPSDYFPEEGKVTADKTSAMLCSRRVSGGPTLREVDVNFNSSEQLTITEMAVDQRESRQEGGQLNFLVESPLIERMDVEEADQIMPEFESFIIGSNTNSAQNSGERLVCDEIPFPSSTMRPASMSTPLSPFPTGYKSHLAPGVYCSIPNGLLENINLRSNLLLDDCALQGKSYSDFFSVPSNQYGWDLKKPFMSPVGVGFEGNTPKPGSSAKPGSSNPELTCFPIQEDPESSEEDVNLNDVIDNGMKRTNSSVRSSSIREPLRNISLQNESFLASNHTVDRGSLECSSIEIRVSEMHDKDRMKNGMHQRRSRQTKQGKENNSLSIGANSIRKYSESRSSKFNKPKLSGKSSLRSTGQSLSEKEPKRNNIVSNVKSFIPLVQQKQAAADVPAKRDVKVKALEAAEAAKRLAEEKENERQRKKEAMKLERARLEQEKLKQMEIKKRLEEEEKKKKVSENAAKRRQREEEEKNLKERKRKRIEEARCQQKQAEEKIQAWREDVRKVDRAKEENISTNSVDEVVADDRREVVAKLPTVNDQKTSTASSNTPKVAESSTPTLVKNEQPNNRASREQSYDISPYQCSDDEDEEEDDIPNKKFIPSWASKSSVALALSSQQQLDPDMIFSPGSFCSLEEVLLPRRIPQK